MKQKIKTILCLGTAMMISITPVYDAGAEKINAYQTQNIETGAAASLQKWNITNEVTGTINNVSYNAYISADAKECWIYRITIDGAIETVNFPNEINGAKVTKIGGAKELLGNTADDDLFIDILGNSLDVGEKIDDVAGDVRSNIKNIVLPDSLTSIGSMALFEFDKVENVAIPDSVENIEAYAFGMCTSIKGMVLPQNLGDIDEKAFYKCSSLETLTVSHANTKYTANNNVLLSKDGKKLYLSAPAVKKVNIPDGVETLGNEAMVTSYADEINIPATVKKMSHDSLSLNKAARVNINKKNKVFAEKHEGIYNKKTGVLACIIVDKGKVVIPEKVKVINESVSVMGSGKTIKKLILPKSLKKLSGAWMMSIKELKSVCFKNQTPPSVKKSTVHSGYEVKPIFCKVYVPKKAKSKYIKWRLKGEKYSEINDLWIKVIGY